MALASSVELILNITGLASGGVKNSDVTIVTTLGVPQNLTLSAGFLAVTVPAGATRVTIYPPVANAQTLTLKGITGDTGIALAKTTWTSLGIDTGVATIGLTAGGTITNVEIVFT